MDGGKNVVVSCFVIYLTLKYDGEDYISQLLQKDGLNSIK